MVAVHIDQGARGLIALLTRALALDAQAVARVQEVGEGQLDVFVTTPFDAIASRRTFGSTTHPGAAVSAKSLLGALRDHLATSARIVELDEVRRGDAPAEEAAAA